MGYEHVIVMGTSQGASSAIIASALFDRMVAGVIAENPFASRELLMTHLLNSILGPQKWSALQGLQQLYISAIVWLTVQRIGRLDVKNPIEVVADLGCPLLLMHGTNDTLIPYNHSEILYAKARGVKQFWLAESAEHTGLQNRYPDLWERTVIGFLEQHVWKLAPTTTATATAPATTATPNPTTTLPDQNATPSSSSSSSSLSHRPAAATAAPAGVDSD